VESVRRSLKDRVAQTVAVASVAGFVLAGAASAAQAASGGGAVSDSGMSRASTCSSTGGGTWCRGSGLSGVLKSCHSNYVHQSNYHSSTATIGAAVDKEYANAGYWSQAYATNGVAFTCYTYWNNNA
jgi:hypothetical protein